MKEWKNPNEVTVEDLIQTLETLDKKAIVLNKNGENIRIYPGRENKKGGQPVVMLC